MRVIVACLILSSCAPEIPSDNWPEPQRVTLTHVWTVGDIEGTADFLFTNITDIDADDRGRIHIVDTDGGVVRVIDQNGRAVRQTRSGANGPGDIVRPIGAASIGMGRTLIIDGARNRYIEFDETGELIRESRRLFDQINVPWRGNVGNETIYEPLFQMDGDRQLLSLVRMFENGDRADTIRLSTSPSNRYVERKGSLLLTVNVPFTRDPVVEVDAERQIVWTINVQTYAIRRLDLQTGQTTHLQGPAHKRAIGLLERRSAISRLSSGNNGVRIDKRRIPRFHPVVADAALDPDGNLWVRPLDQPDDKTVFHIFSTGGLVAMAAANLRLDMSIPLLITRDAVYGGITGDLDVQQLVKFQKSEAKL